ncbi:MAG TPA: alpha-(1-_3)-arabinofuranosyltransferase family protein, partial [Acidimicrobiales bacterium]|nr:alpha-(1->3)-arabinofuranosyltransferase family protein [Acidimicrobiales bacterium]
MTATVDGAKRARPVALAEVAGIALVAYVPLLLGAGGRLNADTKQYLYLDPGGLMERARTLWDTSVGGGAVTHQTIGYLWPMGPFYWVGDGLGLPDWATQRLWIGSIQLAAAVGALVLFRTLMPRRHPAQVVAALGYGLSPFVLGHVTGQSALLLPFAAFGWMVWALVRGLDEGTWRWPAAYALLVTTCGSLNGSSVFFVVLGSVLWVPFGVHTLGRAKARDGIVLLLRAGGLTLLCQLWWLIAYFIGGRYGLPILSVTETVAATSSTTSAAEVLRGLGYWFFYGGDAHRPWLDGLATPYMTSPALLVASFAVPVLALVLATRLRWSSRAYFALLITIGTLIATISFSSPWRSPAGVSFEEASRQVDLVLSLRNTQRAGPLVALGLMGLLSAALTALWSRHAQVALGTGLLVVVAITAALPAQWGDGLIAERFHRKELPDAWEEAGRLLDEGEGNVLELPGIDFAAYRWGNTLDPVSVGLTDRPVLARELVPQGGPVGVSLLNALDRSLQEGWYEPEAIVPMARLLGASTILARNDLEYERYRTVRPPRLWSLLTDAATGLGDVVEVGPPTTNRAAADVPMLDEIELGLPDDTPPPPIALLTVPGGDRPALSARGTDRPTVVDGSGDGLYAAAAAGLLDEGAGPLLFGADLARSGTDPLLFGTVPRFIVTDSNRKADERWYSLRENVGATEPADGRIADEESVGGPIDLVEGQPVTARTIVRWLGAARIWANDYGTASTLLPEDRPSNAFDGDLDTSWRVDVASVSGPYRVGIDLGREVLVPAVTLVQPQARPGSQKVTEAVVVLDGERRFPVEIQPGAAFDPDGVPVVLDGRPFRRLEVELTGFEPPFGPVGLAEVEIPGVEVTELVQPPTATLDRLGGALSDAPVAFVLSRWRADPSEPVRADPEPALRRRLDLPAPVALTLGGTARLHQGPDDARVDELLDSTGPYVRSSQHLPGSLTHRAAAAVDGDLSTWWTTPFVGLTDQWWEIDTGEQLALEEVELDIVADDRHSLPIRIGVSVDGGTPLVVPVPLVERGPRDTTRHVTVPLGRTVRGRTVRISIDGARARTTPDWYSGEPVALPIALAEIGVTDADPVVPADDVDTGCRDDLLTLDGEPLPVRITGDSGAALARGALAVARCDDEPLELPAGTHDLVATPGRETGLDLDRLVLTTPTWDGPSTGAPGPAVEVTDEDRGRVTGVLDSDGEPFWLVLDQSVSDGWDLVVEGPDGASATVDGPHPIDGNAAGWFGRPAAAGPLVVSATWLPQRSVDLALGVS